MSREMAKPKAGSWKRMKKIARYLVNRKRIICISNGKIVMINLMFVETVTGEDELVLENRPQGVFG